MRALEQFQIRHGEGRCLDCYASRRAVDSHWTVLTRRTVGRSSPSRLSPPRDRRVQALPRRLRGDTIGALNLLHTTAACLDEHTQELARALADIATVAILQQRALASSELFPSSSKLPSTSASSLNTRRICLPSADDSASTRPSPRLATFVPRGFR
jgi:hypothetical protein